MRSSKTRSGIAVLALSLFSVTLAGQAMAQSAADKATARKLATDAIDLHRAGDIAGALDRMERAESLYDAPIHVLYIARFQAQLNKLVEAAEGYRRLVRLELSAQAPQAFRDAVTDAQKELAELDPKIPMMRLEVSPAGAKDYKITIDGEAVSSAIVGINRAINPGKHIITVEGSDGAGGRQEVDILVGAKQVVTVNLVPGAGKDVAVQPTQSAAGGPVAAGTVGEGEAGSATAASGEKALPTATKSRGIRLIGGLGVGVASVSGKLDSQAGKGTEDSRSSSDRFGPAFAGELSVGVSIPVGAFNLSPLLFGGYRIHQPGAMLKKSVVASYGLYVPEGDEATLQAFPTSTSFGLGVRFDTAPVVMSPGAFVELGLIAREAYRIDAVYERASQNVKCDFAETFSGSGVRLAGGVLLPATRWLALEGRLGWSLTKMNTYGIETGCADARLVPVPASDIAAADRSNHSVFSLGLGGEFGIGL